MKITITLHDKMGPEERKRELSLMFWSALPELVVYNEVLEPLDISVPESARAELTAIMEIVRALDYVVYVYEI